MKILMINKFLYPNGGSETYMFGLGQYFQSIGHEVQYFGMEHEGRCVGNNMDAYTKDMDFHGGSVFSKITYPFKTIYSKEARKKIRLVLDDYEPDVCHLNNFNYQLTPSIILEIDAWRKETGRKCKIVYTAHDYQLICPNHMLRDLKSGTNCEKCIGGHFGNCTKNRCIHGSLLKSVIGSLEADYWKNNKAYSYIDSIICPSEFMKKKMDTNPLFAGKTIALHNFLPDEVKAAANKQIPPTETVDYKLPEHTYVLYFGRYSTEKGIGTILNASERLPEITFVFAGKGPLEEAVDSRANAVMDGVVNEINGSGSNVVNLGFKSGDELRQLIKNAAFTIYPSEWYENCPYSVMESLALGTPVMGADIGGIPELINTIEKDSDNATGETFESGDVGALVKKVQSLYNDTGKLKQYRLNCKADLFDDAVVYAEKLMKIYTR
ncbi:glycosyltransferase family 4 protein [Butyrivibrio fibrisolvens]|uniref:glycosyltransferase family 4 protein n=1 Tax=Butyrivibrio fibrisolvens TaxID=831 RepID=UPI000401AB4B|nr:glycosyltransferase family 4 protein [Butyrivibrio fibrisolvens]